MTHKITYKAYYHDPNVNPFKGDGIRVFTKTAEIDADVPLADVESWAREGQGPYIFDRVEPLGQLSAY